MGLLDSRQCQRPGVVPGGGHVLRAPQLLQLRRVRAERAAHRLNRGCVSHRTNYGFTYTEDGTALPYCYTLAVRVCVRVCGVAHRHAPASDQCACPISAPHTAYSTHRRNRRATSYYTYT